MKKIFLVLLLGFLFSGNVYASGKVLMYGKYKKNPDLKSYNEHLRSVESGISWMNNEVKDPIYCPPGELTLNLGNIVTAIDLGVKDLKTLKIPYTDEELEEIPVEFIMIKGLKVLFPCEE
jgi:hypothetical protein